MSVLRKVILACSMIGLVGCLFMLGAYTRETKKTKEVLERIPKEALIEAIQRGEADAGDRVERVGESEEDTSILLSYPDCVGWISIEGTSIDYPVMQHENISEYYLYKDAEGNYSGNGTPFLEQGCDIAALEDNLMIYGHHMLNGLMFSGLMAYESSEYARQYPMIRLETTTGTRWYKVFATLKSSGDGDTYGLKAHIRNEEEASYEAFLKEIEEEALYFLENPTQSMNPLLFLVTCSTTTRRSGRLIIAAYEVTETISF